VTYGQCLLIFPNAGDTRSKNLFNSSCRPTRNLHVCRSILYKLFLYNFLHSNSDGLRKCYLKLVDVGLRSFTSFECPTRCRHRDASWRSRLCQHRQHATVVNSNVTRLCCWRSASECPVVICTSWACTLFMSSCTITTVIQLEKSGVVNIFSAC